MSEIKKIIIIGAGISGLTSGIYGQKNGFLTEIFEKNPLPGGLCTSWKRKGYLIDGCIHWLTGTKHGTELNEMWHDVDAFDDEDIIYEDNFGTIEIYGEKITLWTDLNRLEEDLIKLSPIDTKQIKKLIKLIIKIQNMKLPLDLPISIMSIWRLMEVGVKLTPSLFSYFRSTRITCEEYAKRFKSPIIKYILTQIVPGHNNLYSALFAYGTACVNNGGVPKGGSTYIIKRMVEKYHTEGGIIHYNKEVKRIIVIDGKAKGIELKDGTIHKADYVISALDSAYTLKTLLEGKYDDKPINKRLINTKYYPLPSCVNISFVVDNEKFNKLGLTSTYQFLTSPYKVGTSNFSLIKLRDYSYDQTFVKDGKSTLSVMIHQDDEDYQYWKKLKDNPSEYNLKKQDIANKIKQCIVEKFPTLEDSIEIIDVTTPLTYERYCNAYHGAYMPFAFTSDASLLMHSGKIKGLSNFYLSGQWTFMPGGLPFALSSGKFSIQRILKQEKRHYKITLRRYQHYSR